MLGFASRTPLVPAHFGQPAHDERWRNQHRHTQKDLPDCGPYGVHVRSFLGHVDGPATSPTRPHQPIGSIVSGFPL